MAIPVSKGSGGDFKLMPPGTHAAVCDMVANIGDQRSVYQGKEKILEKVYLRFEVPAERLEYVKDDVTVNRPMSIGVTLTNSLFDQATLRKMLESWRGQVFTKDELDSFDLMNILGKPCMITVEHKTKGDKTYANITGISKFTGVTRVAGKDYTVEKPVAEMPLLGYHPIHQPEDHDKLPDWLKKLVDNRVRPEQAQAQAAGAAAETPADPLDDDIPF